MKVTFYMSVNYNHSSHRKETFDYPDDTTDEDLQLDFDDWLSNYLDAGFYRDTE